MDFTQPWDYGDITFVLEDRKIYANKANLAMSSKVLGAMFSSDFKEKKMAEIPLPDKKFDDFLQLMQILHPPHDKDIDESNVECLLPLAHEYQIHHVVNRCERYLLTQPPSIHNLILADKFSLSQLHKVCIEYMNDIPLEKLDEDQDFKLLEPETLAQIYRRKLELVGEISKKFVSRLMSEPPSIKNLLLAEKHDLPEAYEKCMQYLKDTPLSKIKAEAGFGDLKPDTLITVLTHKFETLNKEVADIANSGRTCGSIVYCDYCNKLKGDGIRCLTCKSFRFDKVCEVIKKY